MRRRVLIALLVFALAFFLGVAILRLPPAAPCDPRYYICER